MDTKPATGTIQQATWLCVDLPTIAYKEALSLQHTTVAARNSGIIDTDVVLMLEHPPVFTLGRRGGQENLVVSKAFLEKSKIPLLQVERGGNITFHGPGQLVVYPMVDLRKAELKVVDYVTRLEEVMIRTAADWGIMAGRNALNRGVWVGRNKLGSIGIAIRHGVTFHGFALNVNLSLQPFRWINPCGIQGIGMTSMEQELSNKVSMQQARVSLKRHLQAVFGVELIFMSLTNLQDHFKIPA